MSKSELVYSVVGLFSCALRCLGCLNVRQTGERVNDMVACQGAAGNEMPEAPNHRVCVTCSWFAICVIIVCLCLSSCLLRDKHDTEIDATFVHVHIGHNLSSKAAALSSHTLPRALSQPRVEPKASTTTQ